MFIICAPQKALILIPTQNPLRLMGSRVRENASPAPHQQSIEIINVARCCCTTIQTVPFRPDMPLLSVVGLKCLTWGARVFRSTNPCGGYAPPRPPNPPRPCASRRVESPRVLCPFCPNPPTSKILREGLPSLLPSHHPFSLGRSFGWRGPPPLKKQKNIIKPMVFQHFRFWTPPIPHPYRQSSLMPLLS